MYDRIAAAEFTTKPDNTTEVRAICSSVTHPESRVYSQRGRRIIGLEGEFAAPWRQFVCESTIVEVGQHAPL